MTIQSSDHVVQHTVQGSASRCPALKRGSAPESPGIRYYWTIFTQLLLLQLHILDFFRLAAASLIPGCEICLKSASIVPKLPAQSTRPIYSQIDRSCTNLRLGSCLLSSTSRKQSKMLPKRSGKLRPIYHIEDFSAPEEGIE